MKTRLILLAILCGLAVTANRAGAQQTLTPEQARATSCEWRVVKLGKEPIPAGVQAPTLRATADGKVSGSTSVNRFSGVLAMQDGKLFGQLAISQRGGPPAAAKVEDAFVKALVAATRFTVQKDTLTLFAGDEARLVLSKIP